MKFALNLNFQLQVIMNFLFPQKEAESSIAFFRGVKANNPLDYELNSSSHQIKNEFESIKSLISERASGGNEIAMDDFCKKKKNQ
jgi:hypothetical protein